MTKSAYAKVFYIDDSEMPHTRLVSDVRILDRWFCWFDVEHNAWTMAPYHRVFVVEFDEGTTPDFLA